MHFLALLVGPYPTLFPVFLCVGLWRMYTILSLYTARSQIEVATLFHHDLFQMCFLPLFLRAGFGLLALIRRY